MARIGTSIELYQFKHSIQACLQCVFKFILEFCLIRSLVIGYGFLLNIRMLVQLPNEAEPRIFVFIKKKISKKHNTNMVFTSTVVVLCFHSSVFRVCLDPN